MKAFALVLALMITTTLARSPDIIEWATAISKHASDDRVIVYRFAKTLRSGFERSVFPDRVILVWRYESPSGMPSLEERQAMDQLEDLLAPAVVDSELALLPLVSTGDNLREWTYYTKSEDAFLDALNAALASAPPFPIEIHAAPDPQWASYQRFRAGVKE